MIIILYIAALIVAVAFAFLVVYLIKTLKSTERTLDNVADTLEGLETQMLGITTETTLLLQHTNRLAEDINDKSAKLNGLFDGIKGIGETVEDFNNSLDVISRNITREAGKDSEKASQVVKWGIAIMEMMKRNKNK